MTEEQWLACEDPGPMLGFLRAKATDRKLRLFACACCRRIWELLEDVRCRQAVEAAELHADGAQIPSEMHNRYRAASKAAEPFFLRRDYRLAGAARAAADAVRTYPHHQRWMMVPATQAVAGAAASARDGEPFPQAHLLRDIVGDPFRCPTFDRAVLPPTVASLAQAAYEEPDLPSGHLDSARLAVLSDALEEFGCTDAAVISHLRSPGPHVRGCWAVDVILGMG